MRFNFKDGLYDKKHNFIQCEKVQKLEFVIYSIKTYF